MCSSDLAIEETAVLLALGGVHLAAGNAERSIESYQAAALVARRHEAWPMVCHAWLGVGGACVAAGCSRPAAEAYLQTADFAKLGDLESLRVEALRLAETCLPLEEPQ